MEIVVSAQRDFMEPCTRKIKAEKEKNWTRINLNIGVKHPNPILYPNMICYAAIDDPRSGYNLGSIRNQIKDGYSQDMMISDEHCILFLAATF